MIDDIIKFNREFVESESYKRYETTKYPDKKIAIVTCMDTRLIELLPLCAGLEKRRCQDHQERRPLSRIRSTLLCALCLWQCMNWVWRRLW